MKSIEVKNETGLEIYVTHMLQDLGVAAHIRGYYYLREGIMMVVKGEGDVFTITKTLYPQLARKFNTTPSRVERAVRHAIETSWFRADVKVLESVFRHTVDPEKGKPTNSEYIALISDKVALESDNWNKEDK